jgi:hypothetical protein
MEKSEFEKYKKEVLSHYNENYLIPNVREGGVRNSLLEGLVKSLDLFKGGNSENMDDRFLDVPFKIENLSQYEIAGSGSAARAINALSSKGIDCPLNLKNKFIDTFENQPFPRYLKNKSPEERYKAFLVNFVRNLGSKSVNVLINYLKDGGFDFPQGPERKMIKDL